jgi:hypothetical protein
MPELAIIGDWLASHKARPATAYRDRHHFARRRAGFRHGHAGFLEPMTAAARPRPATVADPAKWLPRPRAIEATPRGDSERSISAPPSLSSTTDGAGPGGHESLSGDGDAELAANRDTANNDVLKVE